MIKKISIFQIIITLLFGSLAYPKTVIDQTGRKLTIPDNPQKIISLAPSVTEIIFAIKGEKRLIAATTHSDYPPDADKLSKIGSYVRFDIEKIISLKPDLCIGIKEGNPKNSINRLAEFNIPVYAVNPKNLDSVISSVIEIGALLNAEKTAARIAEKMKKKINKIKESALKNKNRPTLFFQIDTNRFFSAGADTFIHQLITTAGGKNAAEKKRGYPKFNKEQIVTLSPDIIVIASMKQNKSFKQAELKWGEFKSIPAVAANRIFFVNADLFNRPAPRIIEGLQKLAEIIKEFNKP
ncbi:MAG: ABC transporter substrate-binding protein [Deltaproteobacteria bacterium]|nr:ABC transporter substrate-binding protein [Deltaproteobacteria bacterium]